MRLDAGIAAIVTGGASGLGEATVCALMRERVRVSIFDMDAERGAHLAPKPERCSAMSMSRRRNRWRAASRRHGR